jgi:Fic family protein
MPSEEKINRFLKESNAIEGVFDAQSLLDAKDAWTYLRNQKIMTSTAMKKVHAVLMQNQGAWEESMLPIARSQMGKFRTFAVYIGGKTAMNYKKVPGEVGYWCKEMMTSNNWKGMHVEYERIHPFADGNGRTGRMFMNWHRLRLGLPLLIIKNREKGKYYQWFRE